MRSAAGASCDDGDGGGGGGGAQVRAVRPPTREPLTSSPSDAHVLIYEVLEGQWEKRDRARGDGIVRSGIT